MQQAGCQVVPNAPPDPISQAGTECKRLVIWRGMATSVVSGEDHWWYEVNAGCTRPLRLTMVDDYTGHRQCGANPTGDCMAICGTGEGVCRNLMLRAIAQE